MPPYALTLAAQEPESESAFDPGGDMGTVRKTVGLTDQQDTKLRVLKSAIQEGLDSGVSDKTVPQIMEEVEARLRADERLSTDKI